MATTILAGANTQEDLLNGGLGFCEARANLQSWPGLQEGLAESPPIIHTTVGTPRGKDRPCWAPGGCGGVWSLRRKIQACVWR